MRSEAAIPVLQRALEQRLGLDFSGSRQRNLEAGLRALARELDASGEDCTRLLADCAWDAELQRRCARHFTVAETYFFREQRAFSLIAEYAREKFASLGPSARLRIWSAGCCTGEEAYSAAIALQRALAPPQFARCSVLGTDINAQSLRQAQAGRYGRRSFRHGQVSPLHFASEPDESLRVLPPARDIASFAEHNLASADWPLYLQGMDIILCRNVLMYFSPRQARLCIQRLRACLVDGGWLVVSPSEAASEMFPGFEVMRHPDAIWFRKTATAGSQARGGPPRPLPAPPLPAPPLPVPPSAARPIPLSAAPSAPADPQRALDYCRQAAEQAAAGRFRQADAQLRAALYLDADCIQANWLLGLLLARQDQPQGARRQLQATGLLLLGLAPQTLVPGADGASAADLLQALQAVLAGLESDRAPA